MADLPAISIIVFVPRRDLPVDDLERALERATAGRATIAEIVFAITDRAVAGIEALEARRRIDPRIRLLILSNWFDRAIAVERALPMTSAPRVLTMDPDDRVDLDHLPRLLDALDVADAAVLLPVPARALAAPLRRLDRAAEARFGAPFATVLTSLRLHHRGALEALTDRSVPLALQPLVAAWRGYRLAPVGRDATAPSGRRGARTRELIASALAAPVLFCLLSFARRPLQLFGMVGAGLGLAGVLITLPLIVARLVHGDPLADEPALIPGLLLCAAGVQSIAVGLLAELLVFTRRQDLGDPPRDQLLS